MYEEYLLEDLEDLTDLIYYEGLDPEDAIIYLCEEYDLDVDDAVEFLEAATHRFGGDHRTYTDDYGDEVSTRGDDFGRDHRTGSVHSRGAARRGFREPRPFDDSGISMSHWQGELTPSEKDRLLRLGAADPEKIAELRREHPNVANLGPKPNPRHMTRLSWKIDSERHSGDSARDDTPISSGARTTSAPPVRTVSSTPSSGSEKVADAREERDAKQSTSTPASGSEKVAAARENRDAEQSTSSASGSEQVAAARENRDAKEQGHFSRNKGKYLGGAAAAAGLLGGAAYLRSRSNARRRRNMALGAGGAALAGLGVAALLRHLRKKKG